MGQPDPAQTLQILRDSDLTGADSAQCAELLGAAERLRGWVDARVATITTRLGELHDADGTPTAADVLTGSGVSGTEAKRRERRAFTIGLAPTFGEALAQGRITAEHVDALANAIAKLDDHVRDQVLNLEADLLADAQRMSPTKFARSVRALARRLERDNGTTRDQQQRRDTFLSKKLNTRTGMIEGRFALHPELANQIFGAINREVAAMITEGEQAGDPKYTQRRIDRNRLNAEAWGRLVAGGHQAIRPLEADITIICDETTATTGEIHDHTVCETSDGAELAPASVRRLLCQGRITPIIIDTNGVVLTAGRTIRNANRHQRRALRAMYRTCAFGDCDVPFDRCEIHHIIPWELGGFTDLDNLIPTCSRHHHMIHDHAWVLDLSPDRILTIRQPDGQILTTSRPDVTPTPTRRHTRRRTAA